VITLPHVNPLPYTHPVVKVPLGHHFKNRNTVTFITSLLQRQNVLQMDHYKGLYNESNFGQNIVPTLLKNSFIKHYEAIDMSWNKNFAVAHLLTMMGYGFNFNMVPSDDLSYLQRFVVSLPDNISLSICICLFSVCFCLFLSVYVFF